VRVTRTKVLALLVLEKTRVYLEVVGEYARRE
jgi:hypothetical protein